MEPTDTSADNMLATVTARLCLAAEGHDVPGNMDAALRAIISASCRQAEFTVGLEAVTLAVSALSSVAPAIADHFKGFPEHQTVNVGLKCAGALVETLGRPIETLPPIAQDLYVEWLDWAAILLGEMEIVCRYRRLAARRGLDFDTLAAKPPALH